jgi:hypothetical protein
MSDLSVETAELDAVQAGDDADEDQDEQNGGPAHGGSFKRGSRPRSRVRRPASSRAELRAVNEPA